MMIKIFALCILAVTVYGAAYPSQSQGYAPAPAPRKVVHKVRAKPRPYQFSYNVKDDFANSHSRKESGDANGNMEGSYRIILANGLKRWVQYWADENGFRAKIQTNEPGTDSKDPADVDIDADPIVIQTKPKVHKKIAAIPKSFGYPPRSYH